MPHRFLWSETASTSLLLVWMMSSAPVFAEDDRVIGARPDELELDQPANLADSGPVSVLAVRIELDYQLSARLGEIDAVCGLSADQMRTLRLVGRGDIERITKEAQRINRISAGQEIPEDGPKDLRREIHQKIRTPLANPFREQSFLYKILPRRLSAEQWNALQEFQHAERKRKVQFAIDNLFAGPHDLTAEQLHAVTDVVLEKCPTWRPASTSETTPLTALLLEELKADVDPLLSAAQRRTRAKKLLDARHFQPVFEEDGLWPLADLIHQP